MNKVNDLLSCLYIPNTITNNTKDLLSNKQAMCCLCFKCFILSQSLNLILYRFEPLKMRDATMPQLAPYPFAVEIMRSFS